MSDAVSHLEIQAQPGAAAEQFIERMGLLSQADGLPRIAGRLMALMILEGGPLGFGELAERLQVSRGSISTNVRLLEGMAVIERMTRPGDRGDYFQLASDPWTRLLAGVQERSRKGRRLAQETRAALASENAPSAKLQRLDELAAFYEALSSAFEDIDDHLA